MKVYIDSDYRCHTTNPDGEFREVETKFFDGKCTAFIEGYRCIPNDEEWTRSDGEVFTGNSPWKDYGELDAEQRKYETEKLTDAENALSILLGGEV